ncbi:MAG: 50S ribosomal protein L21e [Candidatus Micrarchaeota archaeon]
MVKRSKGKLSKRSRLLRKRAGSRALGISRLVKSFEIGDSVAIDLKASLSGMPHPRYRGRVGKIINKRGRAYVVEIRDGNMIKNLIISAVHLEKQEY